MSGVEKIRVNGRVWNCYLGKYEDECTNEEIRLADKILDLDEQIEIAYDIPNRQRAEKKVYELKTERRMYEGMLEDMTTRQKDDTEAKA